jgi:4-amino-4-deoxy-L-arabinose transferase-like glycosyltransferase
MTQSQAPTPKLVIGHWSLPILLLLLTWGLRLCCLDTVPPGWRDDELINIHALSGKLLAGKFPLYFTGASGHEPLYHYLHAGIHALLGFNVLSGHLLSVALGTLTVALTYTLARRLLGHATAITASLALMTSFWSLMYSRTAIRHVSLLPPALAAFYWSWRSLARKSRIPNPKPQISCGVALGLLMGTSLYTYPVARLLPVLLILFAIYLALFHRDRFNHLWRGLLLALATTALLAAPLGIVLLQGRADARVAELAVPLRELQNGNLRPLLAGVWTTLAMFHATGDPEWLYNVAERPVFNLLGGTLLWAGVVLCLFRWRQPRYFFLLLWLGLGLLPALVSIPPASLSHAILAQPVAYILPVLALVEASRWLKPCNLQSAMHSLLLVIGHWSSVILLAIFLITNAARDLRDYFVTWPQSWMVRFLYRADYREAARYLDAHSKIADVAISGPLVLPWDRLALEVDTRRDDVAVRLFNPERALVWGASTAPSRVLFTSYPHPAPPLDTFLKTTTDPPEAISPNLTLYALPAIHDLQSAIRNPVARFANGLHLIEAHWLEEPLAPGQPGILLTTWHVAAPLELPPMPIVANPPPPGVDTRPRLKVFVHLLAADGAFLAEDDGLWVDPLTLRAGDRFVQLHRLEAPPGAPTGPYTVRLGLYDERSGERWATLDSAGQPISNHILLAPDDLAVVQ